MKKVGLFFGSNTGNTEMNVDLFKKKFEEFCSDKATLDVFNIGTIDIKKNGGVHLHDCGFTDLEYQ